MLPDLTVVASTSEKCSSPEVLLPDVVISCDFEKPRMRRNKAITVACPSKCKVCRHPATGWHYDAPSCNGCKTFFRRSILDGRKYTCPKMRKCLSGDEPADLTRRLCRACRFESCVAAGMNPEAIRAEVKNSEAEELKNEIILRRQTGDISSTEHVSRGLPSFNDKVERIIENLMSIELKIEPLYTGGLPIGFRDSRVLEEIMRSPVTLSVDQIPSSSLYPIVPEEINLNLRSFVHTGILANIEYSKMFEFGRKIDFENKVLLMKHASVMCADMMTAFYSFDQLKSDKLLHPNGYISGPPKRRYGEFGVQRTAEMQKTLITMLTNQLNRVEYLLLKAIVLCNPAVCGLSPLAQEVIGKEREMYVRSLLTYCLLNCGSANGPARLSALLSIITVLEFQQKRTKDFHHLAKATFIKDPNRKRISHLFEQLMES